MLNIAPVCTPQYAILPFSDSRILFPPRERFPAWLDSRHGKILLAAPGSYLISYYAAAPLPASACFLLNGREIPATYSCGSPVWGSATVFLTEKRGVLQLQADAEFPLHGVLVLALLTKKAA